MRIDPANLPRSVGELRRIIMSQAADIAAEREARTARERELATAKAGLIVQALEIEKLKLQIARLRRQQFGRSSEKIERTIGQFELMLEDLEAASSLAAADSSGFCSIPASAFITATCRTAPSACATR